MTARNLAIVTICSNNYLASAKVFLQSAAESHPEATRYLCIADEQPDDSTVYPGNCHIILAKDLSIPEFRQFAFRYNILEFNTALKPFLLLRLLQNGHDAVLYFDPDIELFAPLHGAVSALAADASFVLTPHRLQPAAAGSIPDDLGIMRAGAYNLGFLGVGATAEAVDLLHWLGQQLLYHCIGDQERGLFVDQRFFDLVPSFAERITILRDSSYNVAYWNLAQRHLEQAGAAWLVDGRPLGFFHFSGFNCLDESQLSRHSSAFRAGATSPALQALMQHHAARVLANGYGATNNLPYGYGHFSSGALIPPHARQAFRERCRTWSGDPFENFEPHVARLNREFPTLKSRRDLELEIQALYTSSSWRFTQPLRMFKRLTSALRQPREPAS